MDFLWWDRGLVIIQEDSEARMLKRADWEKVLNDHKGMQLVFTYISMICV